MMKKIERVISQFVNSSNLKFLGILSVLLVMGLDPALAGKKTPKGQVLAPTGFKGILLPSWPNKPVEIKVTSIEEGSPSSGSGLKPGDVIVGIGSEKFKEDPRPAMAKAIDIGEANGGILPLLLKTGKKVNIQLANLGSYSATAPYNCAKTDKIIEQAVEALLKNNKLGSTPTKTYLLALMATGDKQHLELVKQQIYAGDILKIDPKHIDEYLNGERKDMGSAGWTWGYNLIALGEYYLLTKDENVLPAIRTYAMGLARGQDSIGLWGHRMATSATNGRIPGYGIMNQPSISNLMGMLIAQKCGIKDPVFDKAVEKTYAYVADHVDKGGFNYGVSRPNPSYFNNNGTSGSAAICMSLKGNKHGASYFSQASATSHSNLGSGHASSFFNPLWTPLGASLSGPEVTHQFLKNSLWFFNSKRHWKGGFSGGDKAGGHAAQAILMYSLSRKVLLITGREADESIWVKGPEVTKVIMRSRIDYKSKSIDELFSMFNDPFIQVRGKAAAQLSYKLSKIYQFNKKVTEKNPNPITPKLLNIIKNGKEREKITALVCLGGSPLQVTIPLTKNLMEIAHNKEETRAVRMAAVSAIGTGNFRKAALPFYNDILRLVLEERSEPDPFGHIDRKFSRALIGMFTHLKTDESKKVRPRQSASIQSSQKVP